MKIICKQEKLIKALNIVSRAVSQTSPHQITRGILIKTEGDMQISLSSTDIQMSITTKIDGIVNEFGGIVVSARLFTDLIRKLPAGDILIVTDEKLQVTVKNEKSDYKLQGKDEDEFPRIDQEEEGKKIKIDKEVFREMIAGTVFAASNDESRGVLIGVLFELKNGLLSLVALDGYRVAIKREEKSEYADEDIKAVIPAKLLREAGKILTDITEGEEEVLLDIDERRVKLFTEDTQARINLFDGEFIKYKDVLPKENRISAIVEREELLSAIERAAMLKREGEYTVVRFSVGEKAITLSSRGNDGQGKEIVAAEKTGEDIEIGFDARFVMDALKAIPDGAIEMQFNTSVSPCLIRPTSGENFEYLILPVRLSSANV